jgi:hypothetical protein
VRRAKAAGLTCWLEVEGLASQLSTKQWHDHLADQTLADAILDRLLHNAHKIAIKGPSRRKEREDAHPLPLPHDRAQSVSQGH